MRTCTASQTGKTCIATLVLLLLPAVVLAQMTVPVDLALTKGSKTTMANPGDTISYFLDISLAGMAPMSMAGGVFVLTDTVPMGTMFVGPSMVWDCMGNVTAGTMCMITQMIAIGPGFMTISFPFDVQVLDPLPASVRSISNSASLTLGGEYSDPNSENDDSTLDIAVGQQPIPTLGLGALAALVAILAALGAVVLRLRGTLIH